MLSLTEMQAVNEIAKSLYGFLPGLPHPYARQDISFRGVARDVGVGDFWPGGSKTPAIVALLSATLQHKRHLFCDLILEIVRRGSTYRTNKNDPIRREEIEALNTLIAKVGFKIPDLWDSNFLDSLAPPKTSAKSEIAQTHKVDYVKLKKEFNALIDMPPHRRGYAFEDFLTQVFQAAGLNPRGPFRLVGEQIDGSFELDGETYLVEAKWQNKKTGEADLLTFKGKVEGKAAWSRGLFISYAGFSDDGLTAFSSGRATNIIGMNGEDIWCVLEKEIPLNDAIKTKVRRAAETGEFFVRLFILYP